MSDSADDVQAFEVELDTWLASCHADPLAYVRGAWAWGEGELALETGPKPWQRTFLTDLGGLIRERAFNGIDPVKAIKMAIASGVGPGKTALLAWIFHFILDTRPDSKCRVTANTVTQLDTATWAEIRKWGALKLTANRWSMNTEQIYHIGDRVNWFGVKTTCAPENAQAFAGWHNRRSSTANFYDEGSTIDDLIYEKGRGIEVDGEPFQFVFGNPSRRQGQLYRAVFGNEQDDWNWRIINGEEHTTNQVTLDTYKEWADAYGGRDSDYYRVHVLGLPPNADELQYIDHPRVKAAQERAINILGDEPLVCGVDVSGGGGAWTVARFRKGNDARTIPAIRISGERSRDRQLIVSTLNEALQTYDIAAMFIDSAFGAPVVERLRMLGHKQVIEVNFGGASPDKHDANMRAYMWRKAKDGLLACAIPSGKDPLASDLEGPGYHLNNRDELVIESKKDMQKRGQKSPDDGDSHVLTYAAPVRPDGLTRRQQWAPASVEWAG